MPSWEVRFDLPLDLTDPRLLRALIRAEELARVIHGIYVPPHVRERLDRLNIARAVRGTTAIEGAIVSEDEVARVLVSDRPVLGAGRARDERETRNAGDVAGLVVNLLGKEPQDPLSEQLIRLFNERLTTGLDYRHHTPGHYREHGVTVGTFSPPVGPEVPRLMADFVRWLNQAGASQWPAIARAIAAHFYLVTVHPFGDGNGRTSRAVESYLLFQAGINVFGFYSLSNFYYRNRDAYFEHLDLSRSRRDLLPFVLFAAQGLVEELQEVHAEVLVYLRALAYRDLARRAVSDARLSAKTAARLLALADALSEDPIPIASLRAGRHPLSSNYAGSSIRTLERDLEALERLTLARREGGMLTADLSSLAEK